MSYNRTEDISTAFDHLHEAWVLLSEVGDDVMVDPMVGAVCRACADMVKRAGRTIASLVATETDIRPLN